MAVGHGDRVVVAHSPVVERDLVAAGLLALDLLDPDFELDLVTEPEVIDVGVEVAARSARDGENPGSRRASGSRRTASCVREVLMCRLRYAELMPFLFLNTQLPPTRSLFS